MDIIAAIWNQLAKGLAKDHGVQPYNSVVDQLEHYYLHES